MLRMQRVAFMSCVIGLIFGPSDQPRHLAESSEVRAKVRVAQEKYCRADADLFTVSLKLDVEVSNSSIEVVYLAPKMIPWVARVAASVQDAKSGHFLYEITASHYPQDTTLGAKVRINRGETVTLHTGYDLVAKYDPAFPYPKTLNAGSYAIVLVLGPETTQPNSNGAPQVVESLTTDPFVIRVPQHPKVTDCGDPVKFDPHP